MCGYFAARAVLAREFRQKLPALGAAARRELGP
jgi:hypothetical protein